MKTINQTSPIITPDELLEHWQGHRRLTRRVIEAFPKDKLFNFSIGGMRPFSEMAMELIRIGGPGAHGIATGEWKEFGRLETEEISGSTETKEDLLQLWDWTTDQINKYWLQISADRFGETDLAFGQYEGEIWKHIFYFIDNEIHHRGQGYVYLRALDIEPPYSWER